MNTSFYIAKRYLFAKKSTNAINIISGISVVGVFVGSAALIIILSVFNGFETMVLKMFNTFSPQVLITPATGKTFDPNTSYFTSLSRDPSVYSFTYVLAENAVFKYNDKQAVGLVKGVSDDFLKNKDLDKITVEGKFILENRSGHRMVIGSALQAYLLVNTTDPFVEMQVFSPNKQTGLNSINPAADFTMLTSPISGVFQLQQSYDNMAIVPLKFARNLLGETRKVSAIEINLNTGVSETAFKRKVAERLGTEFDVKNRLEQNTALYNVLGSEKWMVYIILTFILIIAIFNIIGSLTMLVIEKRQDINILQNLGAGKKLIQRIFLFEGMMITLTGCIGGLFAGLVFCLLQQHFGLVKMGNAAAMLNEAYPIDLRWKDFVLVFFTVAGFSFIASALAARLSVRHSTNHQIL